MKAIRQVYGVNYHRNGVSGNGFHLVHFRDNSGKQGRKMFAVVFPEQGNVAVMSEQNTGHRGDEYRGDYFEPELRQAIKVAA